MSDLVVGRVAAERRSAGRSFAARKSLWRSWRSGIVAWPVSRLAALYCGVLTALLLVIVPRPLCADVAGQLWISHHMRMGARLYIDISEVNPPLWFWAAMPLDWIAEQLNVHVEQVLIVALGAASFLSLAAIGRLMKDIAPASRALILGYAALILLILPIREFGQREQYALVLCLPYITLIDLRRRRAHVPLGLALTIGVAAGLGFMLKHYFLAVPVMLELALIVGLRRSWRPVRAESLALGGTAAFYVAAIVALTPEYFTIMVPQLRLAYGASGAQSFADMIQLPQIIWLLLAIVAFVHRRELRAGVTPFAPAYLVAAAGFCIAWYIQHKGWAYQSLPTTSALAMGCVALTVAGDRAAVRLSPLLSAVALLLPVAMPFSFGLRSPALGWYLDDALVGLRSGDVVGLIARDGIASLAPDAMQKGYRFSGRYTRYWALDAADANALSKHDPRVDDLAREFVSNTATDYRCLQPDRIIFQSPAVMPADAGPTTDMIAYFRHDPGFADVLSHYRYMGRSGNFVAYRRVAKIAPPAGTACQRGM